MKPGHSAGRRAVDGLELAAGLVAAGALVLHERSLDDAARPPAADSWWKWIGEAELG